MTDKEFLRLVKRSMVDNEILSAQSELFQSSVNELSIHPDDLIDANESMGYVVDKDNIMHCITSNSFVFSFDGCDVNELSINYYD